MKKNLYIYAIMLLANPLLIYAQLSPENTYIPIGQGDYTWDYPFHSYYEDARTQLIYTAEEIGYSSTINGISFFIESTPGQLLHNFTIRIQHTDQELFDTEDDIWVSDGWTTVYQQDVNIKVPGWCNFEFATPFEYNGVDNLLIDFSFNNDYWTSSYSCRVSDSEEIRAMYYNTDSGFGNPLDWSDIYGPEPHFSSYLPDIVLTIDPIAVPAIIMPDVSDYDPQLAVEQLSEAGFDPEVIDIQYRFSQIADGDTICWQFPQPGVGIIGDFIPQIAVSMGPGYDGGSGTESDPFQINTPQQFRNLGDAVYDYDSYFILTNDIIFNGSEEPFGDAIIASGSDFGYDDGMYAFNGNFNGNYFGIFSCFFEAYDSNIAIFGTIGASGIVHDLELYDINITLYNEASNIGGLSGMNFGIIDNCIIDDFYIYTEELVQDPNDGYDSFAYDVGGISGSVYGGTISNCYASGYIEDCVFAGILAGEILDGYVDNCFSTGDVYGNDSIGGLIGGCYGANVSHCNSNATLEGEYSTGGLIGSAGQSNISQSSAECYVEGYSNTGGLIGFAGNCSISQSFSLSEVIGGYSIGGLVGYIEYYTDDYDPLSILEVDDESDPIEQVLLVDNCYAIGYIEGNSSATGGLIGANSCRVINSYSACTGSVYNDYQSDFIPFIGENQLPEVIESEDQQIVNCFWDNSLSDPNSMYETYATGLSTDKLMDMDTFIDAGWDYVGTTPYGQSSIWFVQYDEYPQLMWETGLDFSGSTILDLVAGDNEPNTLVTHLSSAFDGDFGSDWAIYINSEDLWLTGISPDMGSTQSPVDIMFDYDPGQIAPGLYTADVSITCANESNYGVYQIRLPVRIISAIPSDLSALELMAQYWLVDDCQSYQQCQQIDLLIDNRVNMKDYALLALNWLGTLQYMEYIVADDFETGDFSAMLWANSSASQWVIDSAYAAEGSFSARSGYIGDGQSSELSIPAETDFFSSITFSYKVMSEEGYDFFRFYIDDNLILEDSGEGPWSTVTFPVTSGTHNFTWQYIKDDYVAYFGDCVWIDDIHLD